MQNTKPENPDEKIYLDFGDEFLKIDQKSFSPGSRPPKRDVSKTWGNKKNKKNIKKNKKIPSLLSPPGGPLL